MPPYLSLCMESWRRHLGDWEIVLLDHSNARDYIRDGVFDKDAWDALLQFDLQVQKDAIQAAVLLEQGGIFMDVDTLVTGDISQVVRCLRRAEVVMFDRHLAFVAAQKGARLLTLWLRGVQRRLADVRKIGMSDEAYSWNHLGNGPLDVAIAEACSTPAHNARSKQMTRLRSESRGLRAPRGTVTMGRAPLEVLSRTLNGFILEASHYCGDGRRAAEQYRSFWFEDTVDLERALAGCGSLIGLHNSWTPQWYKLLSVSEVLAHNCLLSRTLRHLLGT